MTEFDDVIRRLEDGRPEATAQELDAIKLRIRRRAAEPSRRSQFMKSRLAILAMLVTGMLFSTAGAGLALSGGLQSHGDASVAQYAPSPEGGVLPAEAESTPAPKPSNSGGGAAPAQAPAAAPAASGGVAGVQETLQPARQAEAAETNQLPFTGFAAIPVLIGGIVLLSGGLLLRRRTRSDR
jgi:hypothetical protein